MLERGPRGRARNGGMWGDWRRPRMAVALHRRPLEIYNLRFENRSLLHVTPTQAGPEGTWWCRAKGRAVPRGPQDPRDDGRGNFMPP